jgi:D-alanyl-lipoteichoic acid acyltransferase DltB (MBOAT superfamily)
MISLFKSDLNYFAATIASAFIALVPALVSAIQLLHSRAGGLRDIYEILVCIAFMILFLGLFLGRQGRRQLYILDAVSSLILAAIFAIFLVKIMLHPSTTGDGDEIGILILPAIALFLTHSFIGPCSISD